MTTARVTTAFQALYLLALCAAALAVVASWPLLPDVVVAAWAGVRDVFSGLTDGVHDLLT